MDRVQLFDKFCDDVAHNQLLLQSSKSKNQNHPTSLIQLSSENVPFANESRTFIITLASSAALPIAGLIEHTKKTNENSFIDVTNDEQIICSETPIKSTRSNRIYIEEKLDNLASKDITTELRGESENEDLCNEDEDGDEDPPPNTVDKSINVQKKNFPTKILEGCKLLYNGSHLLDMISRFYRLECDQCK